MIKMVIFVQNLDIMENLLSRIKEIVLHTIGKTMRTK